MGIKIRMYQNTQGNNNTVSTSLLTGPVGIKRCRVSPVPGLLATDLSPRLVNTEDEEETVLGTKPVWFEG